MTVFIYLGAIVASYVAGVLLAKSLRLKELGWKIGLILVTIVLSAVVCYSRRPTFGVDLSGGTILVYEVDTQKMQRDAEEASQREEGDKTTGKSAVEQTMEEADVDMPSLVAALSRRINPSGVKEIVIRPYGLTQVEIIMPRASKEETDLIEQIIQQTGFLEFRILAHPSLHAAIWRLGEESIASGSIDKEIRQDGKLVAEWVELGREEERNPKTNEFDFKVPIDPTMLIRRLSEDKPEVLVVVDPDENARVEGRHLASVRESTNQKDGSPSVQFNMTRAGAGLFYALTSSHLPDSSTSARHRLGIVLDNKLLSAPGIESAISTNGEITGNFTREEVAQLVRILKAGRLPAVLIPNPISKNTVSPLLGEDTIRKGNLSVALSIVLILIFMVIYYRFAGLIAGVAVVLNLFITVALMISIRAAFTLPGLAGLALTVGMAVDANVLIYERIREERAKGATLRMAIRNGFSRATTTIVDSNLTTVITAVALYIIAPDNIKGFAITLILGICISMFTAIFCARVAFDIAEKKGWLKDLTMMRLLSHTNFDFFGWRMPTTIASLVLIVVGLIAVGIRGGDIFDIDFKEGTSVQFVLKSPMPIAEVREKLDRGWTVTAVDMAGQAPNTVYKIDSPLPEQTELQGKVEELFRDNSGSSLLKTRMMKVENVQALPAANQSGAVTPPVKESTLDSVSAVQYYSTPQLALAREFQRSSRPASNSPELLLAYYQESPDGTAPESTTPSQPEATPSTTTPSTDAKPNNTTIAVEYKSSAKLTFEVPIAADVVKSTIIETAKKAGLSEPLIDVDNEKWDKKSSMQFTEWNVKLTSSVEDTQTILSTLERNIQSTPVWLSSNKTGAAVAENTRNQALVAMLISLVGIIAYIWVRFQRVGYGFAAVLALVHDVLITLGAIALSAGLASVLGFLLVEDFKINLSVIAAFLTIIGFSINDTIVIFDRIREVKGKNPQLTGDIINVSVNQTLSRTILTSGTVFVTVLILYFLGGAGIHAFAFAMLIGVIAGTYSSVFIAAPALIWLTKLATSKTNAGGRRAVERVESK